LGGTASGSSSSLRAKNGYECIIHGGYRSATRPPPSQQEVAVGAVQPGGHTARAHLCSGGWRQGGRRRATVARRARVCDDGRAGAQRRKQGGVDRMGLVGSTSKIEAQVQFIAGVGIKFWASIFFSWTCKWGLEASFCSLLLELL
jgi:hypothetical protein